MPERNQHTSTRADAEKRPSGDSRNPLSRVNHHLSSLCATAALVVCAIALASIVIGVENMRFVMLGIIVSIILLALAFLQEHDTRG